MGHTTSVPGPRYGYTRLKRGQAFSLQPSDVEAQIPLSVLCPSRMDPVLAEMLPLVGPCDGEYLLSISTLN